jgi:glyoxylase-like metal-dependent hydrolase (beta-lactamase superfamily II)
VVTGLAALFSICGCGEPLPIPRIDPVLHAWRQPYTGIDGLRIHAFNTGTMTLPAALVYSGGSWTEEIEIDVPAFVIEHPDLGLIVFDTGFNGRVHDAPVPYLGVVLPAIGSFEMPENAALDEQMKAAGLDPGVVTHIVLSHLHFDHAGAVEAFPRAAVVVARRERESALESGLLGGLTFFAQDWDAVGTWLEIDYDSGEPFATFAAHHDLLGDGSIVLVDLRGHTAGSQGAIVRTVGAPVLLTGDAAAIEQSWKYAARPLVAEDVEAWWEQVWRIKKLVQLEPSTVVVPGHDLAALRRARHEAVTIHRMDGEGAPGGS